MIKVTFPLIKNLSLLSVSVILSLFLLEISLRYFTHYPINMTSNQLANEELLYVLDPDFPEIDRFGFRNRKGPRNQTIFAIGDSHTYGVNVTSDKSWPMQLQKMLNLKVYNFGISGYNIYQYYRLFEMSTQYNPKYVIIGLYPANDLAPSVCKILRLDYWKNKIRELGLSNTDCDREYREKSSLKKSSLTRRIKAFFKFNVALVRALDHLIWDPIQLYFGNGQGHFFSIVQHTVELKVNQDRVMGHSRGTDLRELGVSEHFSNSKILFRRMKRQSERTGVKLLVLIIPSKAWVMVRWARSYNVEVPVLLNAAVENENSIIKKYMDFFSELSIPASDATDRMVDLMAENLRDGTQTYAPADSHPFEAGYSEYAKAASELFVDLHVRQ